MESIKFKDSMVSQNGWSSDLSTRLTRNRGNYSRVVSFGAKKWWKTILTQEERMDINNNLTTAGKGFWFKLRKTELLKRINQYAKLRYDIDSAEELYRVMKGKQQ